MPAAIDLTKERDRIENRELRVSRAIVAPSGRIRLHSHQRDPTIVYAHEGVLSNPRDDGITEEFRSGQVLLNLARDRIGLKPTGQRRSSLSPQTCIGGNSGSGESRSTEGNGVLKTCRVREAKANQGSDRRGQGAGR